MRIEEEIFRRKTLRKDSLEGFGFVRSEGVWRYSETFMDGDFSAEITVRDDGSISGRVMDLSAEEEYLPIHVNEQTGEFVGLVREAYCGILGKIADSCYDDRLFVYEQANRIHQAIYERYGERPDFPFDSSPEAAVYRYPPNRKWYGLVMNISRHLLTGEEKTDSTPRVEVMNMKAEGSRIPDLILKDGIYSAYHMKHDSWISVMLNDTLDDETILGLIDESRQFAVNSGRKTRTGPLNWIVPANPKYYDVEKAFAENETVIWKQGRGIVPGDTVYMYVGSPVSAVRYKCLVLETMIPAPYSDGNVSMTHVMKVRKIREYGRDVFPLEVLKELGVKMLRGPSTAPDSFVARASGLPDA